MKLADYEAHVVRVCFEREPSPGDLSSLGHEDRWLTYRRMVRGRLTRVVKTAAPKLSARLGDELDSLVAEWFAASGPGSPIFHRLPSEFGAFAAARLPAAEAELLRYELRVWDLRASPDAEAPVVDLSFERPIALLPALSLMTTQYRVDGKDADLSEGTQHLLLYRDAEFRIVTLRINDVTHALVEAWMAPHASLAEAIRSATTKAGISMGAKFMDSLGGLLANYMERGIIRGSAA